MWRLFSDGIITDESLLSKPNLEWCKSTNVGDPNRQEEKSYTKHIVISDKCRTQEDVLEENGLEIQFYKPLTVRQYKNKKNMLHSSACKLLPTCSENATSTNNTTFHNVSIPNLQKSHNIENHAEDSKSLKQNQEVTLILDSSEYKLPSKYNEKVIPGYNSRNLHDLSVSNLQNNQYSEEFKKALLILHTLGYQLPSKQNRKVGNNTSSLKESTSNIQSKQTDQDNQEITMILHSATGKQCSACNAIFVSEIDLNAHLITCVQFCKDTLGVRKNNSENRTPIKVYNCIVCSQRFKSLQYLIRHVLTKHSANKVVDVKKEISKCDEPNINTMLYENNAMLHCQSSRLLKQYQDDRNILTLENNLTFGTMIVEPHSQVQYDKSPVSGNRQGEDSGSIALTSDVCSICKKQFNSENDFNLHLLSCKVSEQQPQLSRFINYQDNNFNLLPLKEKHSQLKLNRHVLVKSNGKQIKVNVVQSLKKLPIDSKISDDNKTPSASIFELKHTTNGAKLSALIHKCQKCKKVFPLESDLKRHLVEDEMDLKCDICNQVFLRFYNFQRHVKYTHHQNNIIKCVRCPKRFICQTDYDEHFKIHVNVRFACTICNITYKRHSYFKNHMSLHEEKRYNCEICKYGFEFKSSFNYHMQKRHSKRIHRPVPKQCHLCGKILKGSRNIKNHLMSHTGTKRFKCVYCNKRFVLGANLQRHMQLHTEKPQFQCSKCNRCFYQKQCLVSHIKYCKIPLFSCSLCKRSFRKASSFRMHLVSHSTTEKSTRNRHTDAEMIHKCLVCSKTVTSKASLISHLQLHSEKPQFSCIKCGKSYFQKQTLIKHIKSRSCEHGLSCSICNVTFEKKSRYLHHLKSHSEAQIGRKLYKCSICSRSYLYPENLTAHKQIHLKKRRYQCERCKKSFLIRQYLLRHVRLCSLKNN